MITIGTRSGSATPTHPPHRRRDSTSPPVRDAVITIGSRCVKGAVLDLDGVLVDTEPLHHQAVNEVLCANDRGPLSFEAFGRYVGAREGLVWDDLVRRQGLHRPASFYRGQYDDHVTDLYRERLVVAPGAAAMLDGLTDRGLRVAVVSSARRALVDLCLDALGMRSRFDEIVDGDIADAHTDVSIHGLAARRMDVAPDECLAVEDSSRGAEAAVAAGMLTIVVSTPYTSQQDTSAAHLQVPSLDRVIGRLAAFERPHAHLERNER